MKTNTLHSISIFCSSLAIAIFLVIVSAMGTAKAQNTVPNINQSTINGLFTPTAADRFFEQGRWQMERETKIIDNPERYQRDNILQINSLDMNIIDEMGQPQSVPEFLENSPENQLE